jgi:hypothetical protein
MMQVGCAVRRPFSNAVGQLFTGLRQDMNILYDHLAQGANQTNALDKRQARVIMSKEVRQ